MIDPKKFAEDLVSRAAGLNSHVQLVKIVQALVEKIQALEKKHDTHLHVECHGTDAEGNRKMPTQKIGYRKANGDYQMHPPEGDS